MRAATVDRTAPTSHRALDRLRVEYAKLRRLRLAVEVCQSNLEVDL